MLRAASWLPFKTEVTSLHNLSPQTQPQEHALQTAHLDTPGLFPHSPKHTHKGRLWGSQTEDRRDRDSTDLTAALGSHFSQNTDFNRFFFPPKNREKCKQQKQFHSVATQATNAIHHCTFALLFFGFAFSGFAFNPSLRLKSLTSTCFQ